MQKYIEHICDVASSEPAYTTPVPIDVKTMAQLFAAFDDDLTYIEYKYIQDKDTDIQYAIIDDMSADYFNTPLTDHLFNVNPYVGLDSRTAGVVIKLIEK